MVDPAMVASHEVDGDMCTNVDCARIPGVLCSDQPLYPTNNCKDKQLGEEPDNYQGTCHQNDHATDQKYVDALPDTEDSMLRCKSTAKICDSLKTSIQNDDAASNHDGADHEAAELHTAQVTTLHNGILTKTADIKDHVQAIDVQVAAAALASMCAGVRLQIPHPLPKPLPPPHGHREDRRRRTWPPAHIVHR